MEERLPGKTTRTTGGFTSTDVDPIEPLCCVQPQLASLCAASSRGPPLGGTRPFSQQEPIPQQESEDSDRRVHSPQEVPQTISAPHATRCGDDGSRSSTDSPSLGSTADSGETTD